MLTAGGFGLRQEAASPRAVRWASFRSNDKRKSGDPESNQGPSDGCRSLQSDALPTELSPEVVSNAFNAIEQIRRALPLPNAAPVGVRSQRSRGVTVSTLDSESSDRGSNPRET